MKLLLLDRIHECIISWVGSMLNVMMGSHRLHVFPSNFQRKKMTFRKRVVFPASPVEAMSVVLNHTDSYLVRKPVLGRKDLQLKVSSGFTGLLDSIAQCKRTWNPPSFAFCSKRMCLNK